MISLKQYRFLPYHFTQSLPHNDPTCGGNKMSIIMFKKLGDDDVDQNKHLQNNDVKTKEDFIKVIHIALKLSGENIVYM